ncbi:MAG: ABC transporter permease subunit [Bifidobacterium tibiigranuli]|jgi:NitT/TauT family transport system permease protein|uniref:ABC transporter permease n=1 Tax=Bifidobacterium tibiigranuli TaxID=2172043 RepID=UPI0026F01974|nr:ABC transporter permease subunit [Bifidobacterium tibiigranuli]MCI1673587.1 ABC transporter permease subunit [Bifidobacterium tibiigranuli]MCI1713818.1 ABC transporter permease subunit [Bifidobacterium tibiigranuli]
MTIFTTVRTPATQSKSPIATQRRIISDCLVVAGILAVFGALAYLTPGVVAPVGPQGIPSSVPTNLGALPYDVMRSVLRMAIALAFSFVFSVLYGLAAARSRRAGKVLIPLLDVLQSVPILGFLSATVTIWLALFPGSMLGVEAASIFAIFTSQAWNMTFAFHRSLLSEPAELDEAARMFRLTRWQRFWKLDMPNAAIPMLWNCMMSVGGGWFFLTASEMISVNNRTYALPGIGSYVAAASSQGDFGKVGWAIVAMILVVLAIDGLVWKPLTAWAEKFRITQSESSMQRTSLVLTIIRQSHIDDWLGMLLRPVGDLLDRVMRPLGRTGSTRAPKASRQRVGDIAFNIVIAVALIAGTAALLGSIKSTIGFGETWHIITLGSLTFLRVVLLTIVCSVIWVPIGAMIGMNPRLSRFMQPIVQVLASFPANFLFPFVILWFLAWRIDLGWGSILLMALGTQWYILFNVIAGASQIPDDLREMAANMRLPRIMRWTKLILPAVFGSWCTGGITAAGGAWNASIIAEYVESGRHTLTTSGLGSYITEATAVGDTMKTLVGVVVMSLFVVAVNRLFWNPLERYAAKRFAITA